jgi:ribosomal protein L37E
MLNRFDKFCAALAFVLGAILLVLGVIGLFLGSGANFRLPPVLGALPALFGWGILRCVYVAWKHREPRPNALIGDDGRITEHVPCIKCGYDLYMLFSTNCPECGTPVNESVRSFTPGVGELYRPSRERIEQSSPQPPEGPVELDLPPEPPSR